MKCSQKLEFPSQLAFGHWEGTSTGTHGFLLLGVKKSRMLVLLWKHDAKITQLDLGC